MSLEKAAAETAPSSSDADTDADTDWVGQRWNNRLPRDTPWEPLPFFGVAASEHAPPPPPVAVCPSPRCRFSERATQRVAVTPVKSTVTTEQWRRLTIAAAGAFVAVVVAASLPVAVPVKVLLLGAVFGVTLWLGRAGSVVRTWATTAGMMQGAFVHSFEYVRCPSCGRRLADECHLCHAVIVRDDDAFCWWCGSKYWWAVLREERGRAPIPEWRSRAHPVNGMPDGKRVWTLVASVTQIQVDAVVSTDLTTGRMAGEVGVSLYAIGGDQIEEASMREAGTSRGIGDVWLTEGGALPVDHVVHVAIVGHMPGLDDVRNAVVNCLRCADNAGATTLAIPVLGTGRGVLTLRVAARAFSSALQEWKTSPVEALTDVIVVVREDEEARQFRDILDLDEEG